MPNSIQKSLIVAKFTFLELIKSRILMNVVLLGAGLMVVCFIASEFTYGAVERVAIDFGLGTLSLSSVGIAIFLGVGLVSNEIKNRTAYMIVSRPISRSAFLIGKVLGMSGILALNITILGFMSISLYLFLGGEINEVIFFSLFFSFLESLLVLLIVIFFSLVTNKTMSVIYTMATFVLGHAISETKLISFAKNNFLFEVLLKIYGFIFPDLSKINIKDFVLYKIELDPKFLFGAMAYAFTYILFLCFLNSLIFERKNLD